MDGNYVALAVTLVVWIGLFMFLMRIDKRVSELEKKSK
ncbi:MAG TPA: CcmD family protein [candidate division Zixibacteria bacterium]|nr:CcmD family protein [candidate division Zixibacteria bacterium]